MDYIAPTRVEDPGLVGAQAGDSRVASVESGSRSRRSGESPLFMLAFILSDFLLHSAPGGNR